MSATTGRGRPQGGVNVIRSSITNNITVWFRDVGSFGRTERKVEERTTGSSDRSREARSAIRRQDVGDARGRKSAGVSRNAVGDYLYREMTGNRGTVDGVTTTI